MLEDATNGPIMLVTILENNFRNLTVLIYFGIFYVRILTEANDLLDLLSGGLKD